MNRYVVTAWNDRGEVIESKGFPADAAEMEHALRNYAAMIPVRIVHRATLVHETTGASQTIAAFNREGIAI